MGFRRWINLCNLHILRSVQCMQRLNLALAIYINPHKSKKLSSLANFSKIVKVTFTFVFKEHDTSCMANIEDPDQPASAEAGLIWIHTVCKLA